MGTQKMPQPRRVVVVTVVTVVESNRVKAQYVNLPFIISVLTVQIYTFVTEYVCFPAKNKCRFRK